MKVDDILVIVILVILLVYVYRGCKCESGITPTEPKKTVMKEEETTKEEIEKMSSVSNAADGGAHLVFGTFTDNYHRVQCRTGRFWERKPCEIGNCPLDTTVSDQQFCQIQCAQDPDPEERQKCYQVCMRNIC